MSEHPNEPHGGSLSQRLNALRAAVLGANDGIVSTAGVVLGVAGATTDHQAIMVAGVAALVAGAVSMALGEYVSVSSQRDSERALVEKERRELADMPDEEFAELVALYVNRGLSQSTATVVARELTDKDALRAHLDIELGIDPDEFVSPTVAAASSAVSFVVGGLLPVAAILLAPAASRVIITYLGVLVALGITGALGARMGGAPAGRASLRVMIGGAIGLLLTYGIGMAFGTTLG
ncbi:VIT1/CCC1 transporter family protein [Piscicoccus intestinalis]|uniref:VIT1/CCC1 transporter family protein n=1 Tax=Piscicoccus intestinalis TaxID=746033 RepID=UPI000838F08C|nr:VIT family protein [Piscicoccus intestinalis]